jgi:hypothetical protein
MQQTHPALAPSASKHPVWLLVGFWVSAFIAIAAVLRRLFALLHPASGGPPQMVSLDVAFSSHALLTALHIVPASIFVILAAVVLLRSSVDDWLEQLFFAFGLITSITAYAMSSYSVGGVIELSAVLVFNTWFLFSLGRAFWFRLERQPVRKRAWMTRAVGILLGIATTRPVMGVFFATSRLTHLTPNQFFGIAFWIGFSINAVIIELWLHSKQRARLTAF